MSEASRKRACVNYDRMSRWYGLFSMVEHKAAEAGISMLGVNEGERVLEIGPGSGRSLSALSRISDHVIGVDISGGMLRQARKKAGGVALVRADATGLPIPDASLDAVFMSFTLELFDEADLMRVLSECMRVLKPGGRICVVSMAQQEKPALMSRMYGWSHRTFPGIVDCRPIALRNILSGAGYEAVDEKHISLMGLPVIVVLAKK